MDNSITEQPTSTALSITAKRFVIKDKPHKKGSGYCCLFNTVAGAVTGFVCTAIAPLGTYLAPVLAGGCIGACATCTTLLLTTKSVGDRVIVVRAQPVNAPDSTLEDSTLEDSTLEDSTLDSTLEVSTLEVSTLEDSTLDSTLAPVETEQTPMALT